MVAWTQRKKLFEMIWRHGNLTVYYKNKQTRKSQAIFSNCVIEGGK
jgi:hypothetical protein